MKTNIVVAGLVVSLAAAAAPAGSIWAKAQGKSAAIYADDTARKVGDSVTIVIEEQSKIENETTRKMDKSGSRSAKFSGKFQWGDIFDFLTERVFNLPTVDASGQSANKFDGKAELDVDKKVTDKITVTVQDVQPNGNLVVLGRRERGVSGDKQIIQVSGIVRPSDIAFDNTIPSGKVANFRMIYDNEGQEKQFTNPGWFSRLLNSISLN